jgi:hypothetical protein
MMAKKPYALMERRTPFDTFGQDTASIHYVTQDASFIAGGINDG